MPPYRLYLTMIFLFSQNGAIAPLRFAYGRASSARL